MWREVGLALRTRSEGVTTGRSQENALLLPFQLPLKVSVELRRKADNVDALEEGRPLLTIIEGTVVMIGGTTRTTRSKAQTIRRYIKANLYLP